MFSNFDVAWDPSIARIGYCTWGDGKLILDKCGTMNRPKQIVEFDDCMKWVRDRVLGFYADIPRNKLGKVAIEDFGKHSEHTTFSLLRLAASQGVIYGISCHFSPAVMFRCKGTRGKAEAQTLAKKAGLPLNRKGVVTDHLADAYYIGLLAGFDRG